MTQTLITSKNGKARPKNPHSYNSEVEYAISIGQYNAYSVFESTVQWHDTNLEDGEYEAYLQWQCMYSWNTGQWMDVSDEWYEDMKDATANKYQRIWRIVPQPQEKQLIDIEWDTNTLNPDNYDEVGTPINPYKVQKEEDKTVEGDHKLTDKVDYSAPLADQLNNEEVDIINQLADLMPSCYADIALFTIKYSQGKNAELMEENACFRKLLERISIELEDTDTHCPSNLSKEVDEALKPKK